MNQPSSRPLALPWLGALLLLLGVGPVACTKRRADDSSNNTATNALTPPATPTPVAVPPPPRQTPQTPQTPQTAPPAQADGGEEHMTATHSAEFPFALDFHFARIRGQSVYDLHGQLSHRDGHYFELGPGDTLTLEVGEGLQVMADGAPTTPDLEVEVHPHDRSAREYAIDVSFDHRDTAAGWVELGHSGAHQWDIDHVRQTAIRYVRIRNIDPSNSVYIDGVYARNLQSCTDPSRCRDVNHLTGARR